MCFASTPAIARRPGDCSRCRGCPRAGRHGLRRCCEEPEAVLRLLPILEDRKSTRLNSSHGYISYAVFCLKKKNIRNMLISRLGQEMIRAQPKTARSSARTTAQRLTRCATDAALPITDRVPAALLYSPELN